MCDLTDGVFKLVRKKFHNDKRLRKGFNVTVRKTRNYIIGSTNIYPTEKYTEEFFKELTLTIEESIKGINGEILSFEVEKGVITDLGIKQAEVLRGRFYEIYCYDCFSVSFLRIWLEKATYSRAKWISVDFDELIKTPWFPEHERSERR